MGAYGYSIEQILMVDIIPDASVRRAMNEINAGNKIVQFDLTPDMLSCFKLHDINTEEFKQHHCYNLIIMTGGRIIVS